MVFDHLIEKYTTFIFDFDGVIADTNQIKKENVLQAVSCHLELADAQKFVDDFVSKNGIPREIKFKEKFGTGDIYQDVMARYESLNKVSFLNTKLVDGVSGFIKKLKIYEKEVIILSGGQRSEIDSILAAHDLTDYFDFIFSGPSKKQTNLAQARGEISGPLLYFGDSQQDYRLSVEARLDFVFVSSKTQFIGWREAIITDGAVRTIHDFFDINY